MTAQPPAGGDGASLSHLGVLSSVATGATPMSAFHRALCQVGVGHFNLIRLSSVVPPGVTVAAADTSTVEGAWGDRLFCVFAEQRTSTPGEEVWAAVGWVQRLDGDGGLLVEHEGGSEGFVRQAVLHSLEDMVACEGGRAFSPPQLVVAGGRCEDHPVAALVIVPFATVPWRVEDQG